MINRICISINNRCNLNCRYCHFHEKGILEEKSMDIFAILKNVKKYSKHLFKIGFVGNGEPFLDFPLLKSYLQFLEDCPQIQVYTITNGTVDLTEKEYLFLENHHVNVGFSVDGYKELHNINRCNSFEIVMEHISQYKSATGHYPTLNATVGKDTLRNSKKVIDFFKKFDTRITFSRMIGNYGISLEEYKSFFMEAEKFLSVRKGGLDCTMYGGICGAGKNNYFFANGKVYYCGNCIDLPFIADSNISFFELEQISLNFERNRCYRENLCE